jgi:hypothetical protein
MTFLTSVVLLELVAIAILGLAVSGLVRQVRFLSSASRAGPGLATAGTMNGLVGRRAAEIGGLNLERGRPAILLFGSGNCQVCDERFADLDELAIGRQDTDFRIVLQGSTNRSWSNRVKVLEDRRDIFASLEIPVTPFGIAISSEGLISEARPLGSPEAVRELVGSTRETS